MKVRGARMGSITEKGAGASAPASLAWWGWRDVLRALCRRRRRRRVRRGSAAAAAVEAAGPHVEIESAALRVCREPARS